MSFHCDFPRESMLNMASCILAFFAMAEKTASNSWQVSRKKMSKELEDIAKDLGILVPWHFSTSGLGWITNGRRVWKRGVSNGHGSMSWVGEFTYICF